MRHASDDKLYLYDMVNTKKEKKQNTNQKIQNLTDEQKARLLRNIRRNN